MKSSKNSFTSRNYALPYYQTLEEVPWLLSLEKPKYDQTKISENMKIIARIKRNR